MELTIDNPVPPFFGAGFTRRTYGGEGRTLRKPRGRAGTAAELGVAGQALTGAADDIVHQTSYIV
jgi:hypothetical protein